MKMTCQNIGFEHRPRLPLMLRRDVATAPSAREQAAQLDRGQAADRRALLTTYEFDKGVRSRLGQVPFCKSAGIDIGGLSAHPDPAGSALRCPLRGRASGF